MTGDPSSPSWPFSSVLKSSPPLQPNTTHHITCTLISSVQFSTIFYVCQF